MINKMCKYYSISMAKKLGSQKDSSVRDIVFWPTLFNITHYKYIS